MKELNEKTAGKMLHPERVIQFGEGNFLRAFVDWIIQKMNENVNFNSSVVVVQPIDRGMVDMLNAQDCLYHVNLQGLDKGEKVNSLTRIDVISRALNPYADFSAFMKLAEQPDKPIGKYGRMRQRYLKEYRPVLYSSLILTEKLYPHLLEIDEAANERMDILMPQLMKAAGVTEELKAVDQMKWVGLANACRAQAEEIIFQELISA